MTTTQEAPPVRPALVLDRWNSWVRVLFPETGETRWVDLTQTGYEPLAPESGPRRGPWRTN